MANQIVDNRNLVDPADAVGSYVSSPAPGGASPALDNEVFIEGTGSIGEQYTNTRRGVAYNYGTTQDYTGQIWYVWVNCGIVGRLVSHLNGGFTARFSGPAIGDFFEVYIGGNDFWPRATAGGWVQFAIDMDLAKAASDAGAPYTSTGGTPPALTGIQHVGITALTGAMTKGVDNAWMDAHWLLPKGEAGILVEGIAGGTGSPISGATPWTFPDIFTQLGLTSGAFQEAAGGAYVVNTPIQIGVEGSPASTNYFFDTNSIVLWDSQQWIDDSLYSISAKGVSTNNTYVQIGTKSGTGTSATGSQGGVIAAAADSNRWSVDFSDPEITSVGIYGASWIHSNVLDLRAKGTGTIEAINTLYIDGVQALVHDSTQLKISAIAYLAGSPIPTLTGSPNIPTETGYMHTNDITNISNSTFEFSFTHGIVLSGAYGSPPFLGSPSIPTTQTSTNNTYINYGPGSPQTSVDAAVYNNTGKTITLNSTGDTGLSVRDGIGSTTNIIADPVTTLITVIDAVTGAPIKDARVYLTSTLGSPPTRTYIFGTQGTLTDVNGQVSDSRVLAADLPVTGRVRRATRTLGSPLNETFYKNANIVGTIDNATGFTTTVQLIPDE